MAVAIMPIPSAANSAKAAVLSDPPVLGFDS